MKGSLKVKTFACRVIIIVALLQMRKLRLTQAHTAGSREWSQKLSSCSHAPGPALRLSQLPGPRTVVVLGKWEKPVPRTCERVEDAAGSCRWVMPAGCGLFKVNLRAVMKNLGLWQGSGSHPALPPAHWVA